MTMIAKLRWALPLFIAVLASPLRGDITVRFETPDFTVGLGEVFSLNIVADIPVYEPVIGWGIDLTIGDGSILSLRPPPAIGPAWDAAFANPDGDGLAGLAPFLTEVTGGSVLLASVMLSADSIGESELFLGATLGDLTEGFALDTFGFADLRFESGRISVTPAPSAIILTLTGLPLVGWFSRRCRSAEK